MKAIAMLSSLVSAVLICAAPPATAVAAPTREKLAREYPVHYETRAVDGVDVFYPEAGPADGPVILLLHSFPTSSQVFRDLIPRLSDRYHVIAPDYSGYGHSAAPDRSHYS